ncbi:MULTISPECIES: hypothetical protein [Nocardioides]|uniref:hypothetical protein n=1 Tax=Nocardioides TaxID=1839 RepID=UPI0004074B53|nr:MULTISPECIES: hypothetical protein [Nocardioides]
MELILVAGSIAAALVVAVILSVFGGREPRPTGPQHRLVVATATTLDGVTAHLQASFLQTVTDAATAGRDVDELVEAELEWSLRHLIGARAVAELPATGESVDELLSAPLAGVRIDYVTVESADVVVSPELRRLVRAGPDRWT